MLIIIPKLCYVRFVANWITKFVSIKIAIVLVNILIIEFYIAVKYSGSFLKFATFFQEISLNQV